MKTLCILLLNVSLAFAALKDDASNRGVTVGVMTSHTLLTGRTADRYSQRLVNGEFASLGVQVSMDKWHPTASSYDWSALDAAFGYAEKNGLEPVIHSIIRRAPAWTYSLSKTQLTAELKRSIQAIVKRYAGRVRRFSLVNEAFGCNSFVATGWERIGTNQDSYIKLSVKWAREIYPSGIFILNDHKNEEKNCRSNFMFDWMKKARAAGYSYDGIGLQSHQTIDAPLNITSVKDNIVRFRSAQFQVYVTELDAWIRCDYGVTAAELDAQRNIYRQYIQTAIAAGVRYINFWNLRDYDDPWTLKLGYGEQCLFDSDSNKKPAYYGAKEGFTQ